MILMSALTTLSPKPSGPRFTKSMFITRTASRMINSHMLEVASKSLFLDLAACEKRLINLISYRSEDKVKQNTFYQQEEESRLSSGISEQHDDLGLFEPPILRDPDFDSTPPQHHTRQQANPRANRFDFFWSHFVRD